MKQRLTLQCVIAGSENSRPLLDLLTTRFPYQDRESWRAAIGAGLVQVNGQSACHDQPLRAGDNLTYHAVNHREPPVATDVEIILESRDLLLVGKPAGTPVSRTGLIIHNTLVNILRRRYEQDIHLLHRLDRETSGVLLCARSKNSCRAHQKNLKSIITGKYYLAVVRGQIDLPAIEVDQPLATRDDSPVRCRMWSAAHGQPSRTIFRTIAVTANQTLLLAELLTGRKHQIRAHLAHLGHPLIGDKIYDHGGKYYLKRLTEELSEADYRELGARNHTLHAWAVRLQLGGRPSELRFSEIFSADMERRLEDFPNWRAKAEKMLPS
ncbi:MAG: pseudouridine synthase [Desulfurivibrionaceae bacterium]|nr:pseudouridine synthase [Desulfobulbales bacterium]MDT8334825.1 pseudouridine synthase [Desulfurivibrionaceae bacterium]